MFTECDSWTQQISLSPGARADRVSSKVTDKAAATLTGDAVTVRGFPMSTTDASEFGMMIDGLDFGDIAARAARRDPADSHARGRDTSSFDDLFGALATIPNGYDGLTWTNMAFIDRTEIEKRYSVTGYLNGITSGDTVGFGIGGDPVSVSAGGAFDFLSANLTAAWRNGMTVDVYGYADGVEKYHSTFTVDATGPLHVDLDFLAVDDVRFVPSGGTDIQGWPGTGTQLVFDDVVTRGHAGSISGTVFVDDNGNGLRDRGEAYAVTASDGSYTIAGVGFGTHRVVQTLGDGFVQTSPYLATYDNYRAVAATPGFVDISATGQELHYFNNFEGSAVVNFASPIHVLNGSYSQLYASINGFLSLTELVGLNPEPLPSHGQYPDGMIAPFWADMKLGSDSGVYFLDDTANDRVIVQWDNMKFKGGDVTFEAIITHAGAITFQYESVVEGVRADISVGIEDATGTLGTMIDYKTIADGSAFTFAADETRHQIDATVSVDSGKATQGVDFGAHDVSAQTGSIQGVAFDDADHDGLFGAGDQAKAGWTVFVDDNGDGIHQRSEAITTTAADGSYHFATLAPGDHSVVMFAPMEWQHWQFEGAAPPANHGVDAAATPLARLEAATEQAQEKIALSGHDYAQADFSRAHVDGQLIVKLDAGQGGTAALGLDGEAAYQARAEALASEVGGVRVESSQAGGIELWSFGGMSLEDAAAKLKATGLVAYVQPNYVYSVDDAHSAIATGGSSDVPAGPITNDPLVGDVYGLNAIHAPEAWKYTTGSSAVVVGNIDSGIDLQHPDLIDNLWTNTGEIAGDGIDNDGNGYVDDVHGYDFVNNDSDPDDDNGHGTHTSGTIGAVGDNGIGVSGVAQDVQIMALKFLDASGQGNSFDAVRAIQYATMMGADMTNNSWGGGAFDNAMYDAIAAGPLFIAAAGNDGTDNDVLAHYPSNYDLDNVISVAATDQFGNKAGFSEYGATSVDLAAPGASILSTVPVEQGSYAFFNGTSMATPAVTGAAVLLKSLDPSLTSAEIKAALLAGTEIHGDLVGKMVTDGQLDVMGAINALTHETQHVTVTAGATTTSDFAVTGGATAEADVVRGFGTDEQILGGDGDDILDAGAGNDVLNGGNGGDILIGGAGADQFRFGAGSGADTILDFSSAEHDTIAIRARGVTFDSLTIEGDGGDGAIVRFGTSSIELAHVAPGTLTSDDFVFASGHAALLPVHAMYGIAGDLP